jgi:pyrroloquinoline quinone biosynthesis protein D
MGLASVIPAEARPRLAPKARLRFDRHTDRYLLLYPEKGLELNATAAEIVRLCTGQHTLAELVERLVSAYPSQPRTALERETFAFLTALEHRGLLRYEA